MKSAFSFWDFDLKKEQTKKQKTILRAAGSDKVYTSRVKFEDDQKHG